MRKKININEATYLLRRTFKVLLSIQNLLDSKEIRNLTTEVERYLNSISEYEEIEESQYENLDSRLQVVETFLDSVQSVAKNKKQLS